MITNLDDFWSGLSTRAPEETLFSQILISTGSASADSTNHILNIVHDLWLAESAEPMK